MVFLKELQSPVRTSDLIKDRLAKGYDDFSGFYQEMFDELVRTADYNLFLERLNGLQTFLTGQEFQYRMRSERATIAYFAKYGIICYAIGSSTNDYAIHSWNHENAHKKAASRRNVRSVARVTWVPNGDKGYFIQPWIEMRLSDLKRLAKERQLFSALHEVMWAPSDVGLGYRSEEAIALKLLDAARQNEEYQF